MVFRHFIQEKMGKKAKKKPRSGHKDRRVSSDSPKNVSSESTSNAVTSSDKVVAVKDRRICPHLEKGINLDALKAKLGSSGPLLKCQDCREDVDDRRANKGKGKGKKKGGGEVKLESKSIWICLACGKFSCGGLGFPNTPQSHAIRHSKLNHHQLTVKLENPHLFWCFGCSTVVQPEKSEGCAEETDLLHKITKTIKGRSSEKPALDVEEVWFGSGSVLSGIKSETCPVVSSDGKGGAVRGMLNLGNTCFFNSVMQSLLALDQLRHYFIELDVSPGPLTVSLKKLVVEISEESGLRSAINPKSFFGCVCAKAPQFRGYQQQDSHEFLRCLLDGLSTEESSAKKKIKSAQEDGKSEPTFVEAMFGGQLCNIVTCLECRHASIVHEPFLDLSLPVPTRKPPKKAQPLVGTRKPKLPPRKNGLNRLKLNRNSNAPPSESSADKSLHDKASSDGQSTTSNIETTEPKNCLENDTQEQALSGDFAWLDYLDDDTVSTINADSTGICDLLRNQEYAAEQVGQNDVSVQDSMDCSGLNDVLGNNAKSFDKLTSMNGDVEEIQSDFHDLTLQVNEKLVLRDPPEDFVPMGADCKNNNNSSTKTFDVVKPSDSSSKEDTPLLIEDNAVLLLPYGPILPTEGEVSTSSPGYEHDSLEFDGLGSLFDEPEDAGFPSMNSSAINNPFEAIKTVEALSLMGNGSESDPDEVDNSDAPISVERCLSYFMKSELLTKNEHAWQCENCSKLLQKRIRSRKASGQMGFHQSVSVSNGTSNCINGNTNRQAHNNCDGDCALKTSDKSEMNSVVYLCEKTKGDVDVPPTCSPESLCRDEILDQVNGDNKRREDLNVDKPDAAQEGNFFSASGDESETSDDEKTDSGTVKVERDATKRILISKAPRVLTIHLKRFGQDARGRLSKLTGHVQFNHTIDLKPYIDPSCTETDEYKYRLVGVVEHMGTMRGGHYVAYVRRSMGKAENGDENYVWYNANDAYMRESSLEEVLSSDAYILFYEQV